VTGVDLSEVGVAAARKAAAERGLALDAVVANVDDYDFGVERWNLVTMIYAGGDPGWIARAKQALAPGGLFVLEHFSEGAIGFAPGELEGRFDGWTIVRNQIVEAEADWGRGKAKLIRFAARKP
jgi:SAM-dependent methyltransferase